MVKATTHERHGRRSAAQAQLREEARREMRDAGFIPEESTANFKLTDEESNYYLDGLIEWQRRSARSCFKLGGLVGI